MNVNTSTKTVDASERKEVLQDLAKALKKQGSFTLASKKYTQAGPCNAMHTLPHTLHAILASFSNLSPNTQHYIHTYIHTYIRIYIHLYRTENALYLYSSQVSFSIYVCMYVCRRSSSCDQVFGP